VLVVPLKHLLAKRKEVDIADLGSETFVGHIVESPFRRRVIELFARHRATLNMPIEMPTIESIKRFVQMGMGVAIVPRMCVQWGDRPRLDERSEGAADEHATACLSGFAARRAAAARGGGADAHPARRVV